jgi:glycolate oxidase FAD binding subunit
MDAALAALVDQVQAARAARPTAGHPRRWQQGLLWRSAAGPAAGRAWACRHQQLRTQRTGGHRARGTPLAELEAALAEKGQCLPFEPPRFGRGAPWAAWWPAGLAGPARVSVGSVRDYVLGATLLNGRGEVLSFGGQVMKNVAGYDVSRVLAGSMGIFGVICEVSLKVLPVAPAT